MKFNITVILKARKLRHQLSEEERDFYTLSERTDSKVNCHWAT